MNTKTRHFTMHSILLLACSVLLLGSTTVFSAEAPVAGNETDPQNTGVTPAAPLEIKKRATAFEYQIEGRPDPFMPFITERATTNENPDEIIEENRVLTGMQLFEPGQLTLVALMMVENDSLAMVQDFTGKGYIIMEGTKIGRRGVVSEIAENKVIIEETALTRGGKTLTNQIAMVLKKEGEE